MSEAPARADDAHLREETVSSETVFQGRLLQVRRDRIRLPDGGDATREFIVHGGAVMSARCSASSVPLNLRLSTGMPALSMPPLPCASTLFDVWYGSRPGSWK